MGKIFKFFLLSNIWLLLFSCANQAPAKVIDLSKNNPKIYQVNTGDTLYSIASRYQLSVAQLAKWNSLTSPYILHSGQLLYLQPSDCRNISENKTKNNSPTPVSWVWPAQGKIIQKFMPGKIKNNGIDISNIEGTPIYAAASGEVVYSGSALRGYGYLIIIRHSENFITAYAHNRKNIVKEGEFVKTGVIIAEMGKTGSNQVKLHFEVRKNGKPVDPCQVLPKP